MTVKVYSHGGFQVILRTLYEHPAVSSVGYDVIFCWMSWMCWLFTQGGRIQIDIVNRKHK
jgi:hypothetical protein